MKTYRRALIRIKHFKLKKLLGPEHPATRAAFGRMLVYGGDGHLASKPDGDIELVSWYREGERPGYLNRGIRSYAAK